MRTPFLIFFCCIILSNIQSQNPVLNELLYRRTSPSKAVRFVELYNNSNAVLNIADYKLEGSIYFQFPSGAQIQPNSYLLVAEDPADLQSNYSIPSGVPIFGPWIGTMNLYEGEINIHNEEYCKMDGLNYSGWHEWPSSDIGSGVSIQKMNPSLPSKAGGAWDSKAPTPGNKNSSVFQNVPANIPALLKVNHSPNRPSANETVLITASLLNIDQINNLEVTCDYQIVDPGQYISRSDANHATDWQTLSMADNGANGDVNAGDGIFSINIPASIQTNRRLIRYRIRLNNSNGFNRLYPDQDFDESNYGYYVYNSFPDVGGININTLSDLQNFTLVTKGIDDNGTNYSGTLVTGTEVYDHVRLRKESFYSNPRRNYLVNCNDGRPVEVQNDEGNTYKVRRDRLHFSGTQMNDRNSHGLIESIVLKVFELAGVSASFADYAHVRIVDNSNPSTDFEGIHVIRDYMRRMKAFNGDFLKLRDLPDGNIHGYKFPFTIVYDGDLGPYGLNNSELTNWNNGWDDMSDACSSCPVPTPSQAWLEDNLDLKNHYRFMSAQEVLANNETNYAGQHNYFDYYNPVTDKWTVIPDDFNATFGAPRDENGVAQRTEWDATEDVRGPFKVAINAHNPLRIEFENNIRSVVDLLCNTEQGSFLVENEVRKIYDRTNGTNWIDADRSRWNQSYSNYEAVLTDYKNYFSDRENHLANFYNSGKMPNKPTISYTGQANFPINNLTFSNSAFSDPQGAGSFESLEWRIAEWSDPSNSIYQNIVEDKYEISPIWESGDINTFSNSMTIDGSSLLPGRTYRVRVRYKDNTGRKSLWSDPIQFISGSPVNYQIPDLVITEILYNAADSCGENFIEILNNGNSTVDLSQFKLDGDIQFTFPDGSTVSPNSYIFVAHDDVSFSYKYNKSAAGQWSGELSKTNGNIRLKGLYDQLIDVVNYSNASPWPNTSLGFSIHITNPNSNNAVGSNWLVSSSCGQPGQINDMLNDSDNDGVDDSLDQCPGFDDALDADGDGIPDGCDNDADNDGVPDGQDQCPGFDDNLDADNDNIPDGCDNDSDNDGVLDNQDQCPGFDDALDADGDGIPDGCDIDTDNDGVPDSQDQCPGFDDALDVDSDGIPDGCDDDADNDGVPDGQDQCPGFDDTIDADNDNIPDGCDTDNDNDGVPDNQDQCPGFDDMVDLDNSGIADGCDTDTDNDGVSDSIDQCPGFNDTIDSDGDGIPDGCDICLTNVPDLAGRNITNGVQAMGYIKTNGLVQNGFDIRYAAGNYVELYPGFEVELGGVFEGLIEDCQ